MTERFAPGEVVAWRNCPRQANRQHGPSFAIAMRVVRDEPDLLMLYRGPGYPMARRNSERVEVDGFRHQPVRRLLEGWKSAGPWTGRHVLLAMDPNGAHAISLFRDAASDMVEFWYVDVIGPVQRRGHVFDFYEHGLDAVIAPDHSSWYLKDDDELQWNVGHGVYTDAEAAELRAEAKRAVLELRADRARFEEWLAWRPDPSWTVPELPEGWDAI